MRIKDRNASIIYATIDINVLKKSVILIFVYFIDRVCLKMCENVNRKKAMFYINFKDQDMHCGIPNARLLLLITFVNNDECKVTE